MRYFPMFPWAIPHPKVDNLRVTHPFATLTKAEAPDPVRLACLKRAASVRSEPGSNSPSYNSASEEADQYPSKNRYHSDRDSALNPYLTSASYPKSSHPQSSPRLSLPFPSTVKEHTYPTPRREPSAAADHLGNASPPAARTLI